MMVLGYSLNPKTVFYMLFNFVVSGLVRMACMLPSKWAGWAG